MNETRHSGIFTFISTLFFDEIKALFIHFLCKNNLNACTCVWAWWIFRSSWRRMMWVSERYGKKELKWMSVRPSSHLVLCKCKAIQIMNSNYLIYKKSRVLLIFNFYFCRITTLSHHRMQLIKNSFFNLSTFLPHFFIFHLLDHIWHSSYCTRMSKEGKKEEEKKFFL